MLSMGGRPSSRLFFFLRNICIQVQKQRLERYIYINKIVLMLWKLALHLLYFNQNEDSIYNSNFARKVMFSFEQVTTPTTL